MARNGALLALELPMENATSFNKLKQRMNNTPETAGVDDFKLLRFLRARDFDIDQAESMLRKNLAWRKKENIDAILQDYKAPEVLEKYNPLYLSGFSLESQPVVTFQLGDTDFKGILKSVKKEGYVRHIVYIVERAEQYLKEQSEKLGKHIDKWIVLLNFENSTLSQVTNKTCLQALLSTSVIYESNYPERLHAIYILNANTYFTILFNALKTVLSPVILNKVQFIGKENWKEALGKIVDPGMLVLLEENRKSLTTHWTCLTTFNLGGKVPKRYYFRSNERRLNSVGGFIKYKVKRSEIMNIPVYVKKAGSYLDWKFEIDDYDILFGLFYKSTDSEHEQGQTLIEKQRVDSELEYETGSYLCQKPGIYILTFDNSYSWFRQKLISVLVSVNEPEEKISINANKKE